MLVSFNCSVLSDTFNLIDSFLVNFNKENDENIIAKLGNNHYDFKDFKVGHLKDYICDRRKVADSDRHAVKLWKVDVKDESDIKEKPKEDEMKPRLMFKDYFQDELNGVKFTMSNIHVIAIIPMSFNCSVLSDTVNPLDSFLVNFNKENNENIIAKLGNNHYDFKDFKVGHLKDYICDRRKVADSDRHAVKLWKVDVKDESDIKEKPKEDEMKPRLMFKDYFQDELNGVKFTMSNIHVIAIIPMSFNCSVLSDTVNPLDSFLVNFNKENNENIIAKLGNNHYDFKDFKVGHLKDYICDRRKVADSDRHAVKLWKVDVKDESDIKEKPKEDEMKPRLMFKDYFQDELNGVKFTMSNIHVIAIIPMSFNCSVLSDTVNPLDSFLVNFNKENNENIIAKLGNNHYDFKDFKVGHLKDYICDRRKVADSDRHAVKLWKVDVKDESDIKEKPKEDEMKPRLMFKDYFQDELNGVKFTMSNIHVIAIIPSKCLPMFYLSNKKFAVTNIDLV
ncbi:hypothetical protein GLOIN_2v1481416 [Rhizophagus irregularis DAOM 181602=DAOM 197198]|uniref:Uncharacterized protein n=1 Tax=Rhizophagus irregularis (strain DAOM 181602 / DAOM 197198 / MUCL 43194) TaxID=747089 RepID=A0A2P4PQB4_RHIID|nr:hypothetical protein GLOIN_2v1481416 [Rhizophagus irregularis DAOM 181602=DAOM 197198]POG67584.1 hypothetical protein GLOIN_2v1481416 [Rhizophagus irregularis DAOM 181602=DAOM 197198]|eukprot:XP_025174450.1 hypothetical protein GLOIN_2v1481416 [Rhizophagus irregularis DAOM 181602=DAOM 197198]